MSQVKVTVTKNGPYKVEGEIEVFSYDGTKIDSPSATVFLCRCGASTKKPFCDGTHSKIGFDAAAQRVPQSKEQ